MSIKKSCEFCLDRLSAFMDKELPPDLEARVRDHLESCPECAQKLQELKRLNSLLGDVTACAEQPVLDIEAMIRKTRPSRVHVPGFGEKALGFLTRPWTWVPAAVIAAAALVIMLVPVQTPPGPDHGPLVSSVESVSSDSQIIMMQTAGSGQPLIWITPQKHEETES